jgi:hypothetical protein
VRGSWCIAGLLAGCSFNFSGLPIDGVRDAAVVADLNPGPVLVDLAPGPDLLAPPDLAPFVKLNLVMEDASKKVDLTQEGLVDWRKFSHLPNFSVIPLEDDVEMAGADVIGPVSGAVGPSTLFEPEFACSWSNGTPNKPTGTDDESVLYVQAEQAVMSFKAKASSTSRTLRIYASVYDANARLTVKLAGQTRSVDLLGENLSSKRTSKRFVIDYASKAGDELTVEWRRIDDWPPFELSGIDLTAATVRE